MGAARRGRVVVQTVITARTTAELARPKASRRYDMGGITACSVRIHLGAEVVKGGFGRSAFRR